MQKNSPFPRWLSGKEWCLRDTRDADLIPGLGRFPGVGNGNLIQYSSLENSMDRSSWGATVHGVMKSQTQLNTHTHKRSHSGGYILRLSTEGMGKNAHLSLFPWKKLDCTLSQLLPEGQPLTSLHPTADFHPLGHWKVLAYPQPCWQTCGEKGTLIQCWWECKLVKNSGKHFGGSLRN